jgi:tetratricopeptide (TPR) repeat protein
MRSLLVFALLSAAGCAPRVLLTYDMPAELTVPTTVQSLAVVDRKGSDLSAAARLALQDELLGGPRYRLAEAAPAQSVLGASPGVVGAPLDVQAVLAMRKAAASDGMVVVDQAEMVQDWLYLPRVEERTRIETRKPADCESCDPVETEIVEQFPVVDATLTVTVTIGYQLYGVDGGLIEAWTETWTDSRTATAERESDARAQVGDPRELALELAAATAFEAARHIAPWTAEVSRRWYAGGGAEVSAGAKLAREGNWAAAEKAWRKARKTAEGDTKGRVLFNLAVAAEQRGDIVAALENLKAARALLKNTKHADAYLVALKERRRQAATLSAQMAPPPADD